MESREPLFHIKISHIMRDMNRYLGGGHQFENEIEDGRGPTNSLLKLGKVHETHFTFQIHGTPGDPSLF